MGSMRRKIPSTTALTAFEAAARHQSYTKAADELSLTQSAVCRQVASLESFLGLRLFQRNRRGVVLTTAGAGYAGQVRARLDDVERDALAMMAQRAQGGVLELGVVPTFATRWLLPRLPHFLASHPGIEVHLSARTRPFLFEDARLDAAIHAGVAAWPGTKGIFLMPESLVPVCSPALTGSRRRFGVAEWQCQTLLQQSTRPYVWREWFAANGLQIDGDMSGPRLELFSMAAEAAVSGLGVALVPPFVTEREIAARQLVTLAAKPTPSGRSYFLIFPEERAHDAALQSFAAWVQSEAQRTPAAA